MDKSLLIHADNTPSSVQELFLNENIINFNYRNHKYSNIDEYISKVIIEELKNKDFDLIYIKDTLSSNYLELYGLIVAYHIRLSTELKDKRYLPIVILSDIDGFGLNNIAPISRILFTQNIYLEANNKESIKKYNQKMIQPLNVKEYESNFFNIISIDVPENSSSHSIANEWAIYRWAEFLKINDSQSINQNREKIASMLYFKYLLARNPISIKKKNGIQFVPRAPENGGKILYIDDEWAKGWSDILKRYFSKNPNIEFETFEYNFKDNNKYTIISAIEKYCKSYNPDIVLLDLRLTQSDHKKNIEIENFTGIKVTEIIKKINPAIQVIILSATSKSSNLENLYKHGILGYIKKEHPTDVNISTKENFDKLKKMLDRGFEKQYLKEIWEIQKHVLALNIFQENKFRQMRFEIDSVFEILNSDMHKRYIYAMLSIFQSLEEINNYYIDDRTKQWKDRDSDISIEGDGYTKQKIEAILKRLGLFEKYSSEINNIAKMRKSVIHPPQKGEYDKPTKDNILTWFKMLQMILKKI